MKSRSHRKITNWRDTIIQFSIIFLIVSDSGQIKKEACYVLDEIKQMYSKSKIYYKESE